MLPLFRRCLGHVRSQPNNAGKNQRAVKILVYHPSPSQYGHFYVNGTLEKRQKTRSFYDKIFGCGGVH